MSLFPPPIPTIESDPKKSYWQSSPHPKLANYSSAIFPSAVDTVIIGSGLSGTLIARDLLQRDHGRGKKSLLMLEARSLASGATGRNGGHIKPDCYRGFNTYEKLHGSEIARQQCEFERANLQDLSKFIKEQGLAEAAELVELRTCDAYMSDQAWKEGYSSYQSFKAAGGNVEGIEPHDSASAEKDLRIEGCHGAITYPACSLWPYKLVMAILERCIANGLLVHANTPALSISRSSHGEGWEIDTPKGKVSCHRIVHATNGYSTYLLPELSSKHVPLKGNVVAIDPPDSYLSQPFDHTYAFHWGEDFDYLIQRPNDGKPLIYGGGDLHHPRSLAGGVGDSDDSTITPEIVRGLESVPSKYFRGWQGGQSRRTAWSGIMALTADELPYVGELPGKPGQFVATGYCGHGMARAFLTVRALCQYMYSENIDPRIPPVYFDIEARLQRDIPAWTAILKEASSS